jgi:hypothetical protein
VIKSRNPGKKGVVVRPSRIRRDPVPPEKPASLDKAMWQSREWEIGLAVVGIILFALAINAISIGLSAITG